MYYIGVLGPYVDTSMKRSLILCRNADMTNNCGAGKRDGE